MSVQANKRLAGELFARLSAGDTAGALEMLSDDATWWIAGKPGSSPVAGRVHSKAQIARLFATMLEQLKDGLRMTVKRAIADGDRVALEVESHGELRNGRIYDQEYHFSIAIRDGRISAVKEYLDTQHAFATWFQRGDS